MFRQSPAVVISLPSHQEESVFVWTINKYNPEMRNENFNEFMDRQLISKEVWRHNVGLQRITNKVLSKQGIKNLCIQWKEAIILIEFFQTLSLPRNGRYCMHILALWDRISLEDRSNKMFSDSWNHQCFLVLHKLNILHQWFSHLFGSWLPSDDKLNKL